VVVPDYFSLIRKTNPDAGSVPLQEIDSEMCTAFGITPNPVNTTINGSLA
jgi:hypothetical protein